MDDINVHLTSDLTSSERRLSPDWTLEYFKNRVEQITGIPPASQKIWIYQTADSSERTPINDSLNTQNTHLEDLKIHPGTRIHIESKDNDPELTELQRDLLNTSDKNELYKLDEKQYDQMPNTVKRWKQENKLGRYDPVLRAKKEHIIQEDKLRASEIHVGDRCKLTNSSIQRLGTVRYVGKVPEIDPERIWIGVELDDPFGKNDGCIKGGRYFTCKENHGSFVRPLVVKTGDFPPEELPFDEKSDDEL